MLRETGSLAPHLRGEDWEEEEGVATADA